MERKFKDNAEQFRWFLDICHRGMDANGTIVCFSEDEDRIMIRQAFVEVGWDWEEDFSIKALAVKKASEAFLVDRGIVGVEVVVNDLKTVAVDGRWPVVYKQVAFKRIENDVDIEKF